MGSLSRRGLSVTLLVLAAMAMFGCASPTLPPLPPPTEPQVTSLSESEIEVNGALLIPEARVLVLNYNTRRIFGQLISDGSYRFRIKASPGDYLELWYEADQHTSQTIGFDAPQLEGGAGQSDAGDAQPTP